ncbi:MAG: hypothetical protein MK291_08165 [Planctomycetes bacterium]|nr:hypothetical protein [Planctomycetota bacterium]
MRSSLLTAALAAAIFSSCVNPLPKGVAAHPQGLLPSQDTVTTPAGFLEVEAVGSWAAREEQAMAVMRYGLGDRTEVYLAQDLHHSLTIPGAADPSGLGDAWIGVRHRVIDRDSAMVAHAFLAEVRIPHSDTDPGINADALELHLGHLRDGSWGRFDWTTNVDLFFLADPAGRPDPALGGSLTLSSPLLEIAGKKLPLALLAEAGGLYHPEEDQLPAWVAAGIRIPLHPSLELQAAWIQGLGGDAPDDRWALNLGRLVGDALLFGRSTTRDS